MKKTTRFSPEVRERAVRMVSEQCGEHGSQWAAIESIASKIGCSAQMLHNWVRQYERDTAGQRDGVSTAEAARIKALEREVRELRRANEILRPSAMHWSITAIGARSTSQFVTASAWQKPALSPRLAAVATQRPVQGRSHSSTRPLEERRGG